MLSRQLWFTKPGEVEVREQELTAPNSNQVLVKSLYSAISTGTEMLVFRGQLPEDIPLDTSIEELKTQTMSYPLRYGYATVATIEETGQDIDKSYVGKKIFAYVPHASHSLIPFNQLFLLPDDIDPEDAVFLANMETAVNLVHDGNPLLGEKVVVIGLGVVGLLTSCILAKFPLAGQYALENIESRRDLLNGLGNCQAFSPGSIDAINERKQNSKQVTSDSDVDLCFEVTGNPRAMDLAIELSAYNGRIVVGSWYGNKSSTINLGGKFHRNRIKIISSQVSTIAPELTGRWNKGRRLEYACNMIKEINPAKFISKIIEFEHAQQAYNLLETSPEDHLQIILKY